MYGPDWNKFKRVIFYTKNKYKPSIDVKLFKPSHSYLTYEVTGQKSFFQFDKNSNMLVNLGPFYLVWDSSKAGEQSFVYQIEKIDIVKNEESIAHVKGSNKKILIGEKYFKQFCVRCHSINGKGGTFGKDLGNPNIVKSKTRKFVIKYILNPKDVKAFSKMPPLRPTLSDKIGVAESITLFLESVK